MSKQNSQPQFGPGQWKPQPGPWQPQQPQPQQPQQQPEPQQQQPFQQQSQQAPWQQQQPQQNQWQQPQQPYQQQPYQQPYPQQPMYPRKKGIGAGAIVGIIVGALLVVGVAGYFVWQYLAKESEQQYAELVQDIDETNVEVAVEPDVYDFVPSEIQAMPGYTPDFSWLAETQLDPSDVYMLSDFEKRLLRNAIYARHGYIFRSPELTEFFSRFPWYEPRFTDVTSMLNTNELYNVQLIKTYE